MRYLLSFHNADGFQALHRDGQVLLVCHNRLNILVGEPAFLRCDREDEPELLIDVLSFGPVVRVLGPEDFVRQVRQRVERQHQLFYGMIGDIESAGCE